MIELIIKLGIAGLSISMITFAFELLAEYLPPTNDKGEFEK